MKLREILKPITFSFLLCIPGCGDFGEIIKKGLKGAIPNIWETRLNDWSKISEEYTNFYRLIVEEKYGEAKKILENSLLENVQGGYRFIGALKEMDSIPEGRKEEIITGFEQGIDKIKSYLENSER